eukprot:RCo037622
MVDFVESFLKLGAAIPPAARLVSEADRREYFLSLSGAKYGHFRCGRGLTELRETEFSRLHELIYLDHTGSALYPASYIGEVCDLLQQEVFGNPHTISSCSRKSQANVERARQKVLEFFSTDDDNYDVIFTSSATQALRIVGESFPWDKRSVFGYTFENHTSVLGLRSYAASAGARVASLNNHNLVALLSGQENPLTCHDSSLDAEGGASDGWSLFAFPAEENFSGRRLPVSMVQHLRKVLDSKWKILVDAASWAGHSPLSLAARECQPDYVVVSFYKICGFPTSLGALLCRRPTPPPLPHSVPLASNHCSVGAGQLLRKRFVGGGSVLHVSAAPSAVASLKELPERFEDGTVDFIGLTCLPIGLRKIQELSMEAIHDHCIALAQYLAAVLDGLRHSTGVPAVVLYGAHNRITSAMAQGPIVTFNVVDSGGRYVGLNRVLDVFSARGIQVRGGMLCNAGACLSEVGIPEPAFEDFIRSSRSVPHEAGSSSVRAVPSPTPSASGAVEVVTEEGCGTEVRIGGLPLGAIRVSVGYYNTFEDVDAVYSAIE